MSIVGYTRTGRVQLGPASDLVEMQGPDGARHTGIVFHPEYRKHNAINAALGVVLGFLESPMVTGLADLTAYDLEKSTFVYPTGHVWSVAEVVRTLGDLGEVGGVRAGVELMIAVGEVLVEAAENGESQGVYSHGGLTPWRVVMDASGRASVIGHALPQVEILTFHEQPDRVPREDAFRYCPPERMESKRENFSSDVFSLGLIAFEIMTGKPIYDGLVNDIRGKAARGETSRRIHQFRDYLPEPVRELLIQALRPDFRDRFQSGSDFLDTARSALAADPEGGRLCDMMERVSQQVSRAREQLDPARTSMLSKEELARLVDEEAGPVAKKPVRAASPAAPAAPSLPASPVSAAPRAPAASPVAAAPAPVAPAPAPVAPAASPSAPPDAGRRLPPRLRESVDAAASDGAPVASALGTSTAGSSLASLPARRLPPRLRDGEPVEAAQAVAVAPPEPQIRSAGPPAVPAPTISSMDPLPPPSGASAPSAAPLVESSRWSLPARRPNPRALASEAVEPAPAPPIAAPTTAPPPMSPARATAPTPPARPTAPPPLATSPGVSSPPSSPGPTSPTFAPSAPSSPAAPVSRASAPSPVAAPAPSPVAPPSAWASAPGPRTVPALPESARAVPPPPAIPGGDRAADLLRRIRESSGEHTRPSPIAPRPEAAVPADRAVDALPLRPSGTSPSKEGEDVRTPADRGVHAPLRPSGTSPSKEGEDVRAPAPLAAASPSAPSDVSARSAPARVLSPVARSRTPDPVRTVLRGEAAVFRLCRGPGAGVVTRRLLNKSTLGDVVAALVGQVVPLRTTPDGRLVGWYRLGPQSGPLPASTQLDTIKPEETLHFHFVAGQTLTLGVEATVDGRTLSLVVPMHTAVPAATLVDALCTMLGMPAGEWSLLVDGFLVEPSGILEDVVFHSESRLKLVKA